MNKSLDKPLDKPRAKPMKIAVLGTGGVGGLFGALFSRAGHLVHFIARGNHLKAIQSNGLQVESSGGNFKIKPAIASTSLEEAVSISGSFDLVLVCVKTWQLPEACEQLSPLLRDKPSLRASQPLILPLQNGMEASEWILGRFPHADVLRGFCAVISFVSSPGVISHVGIPPYLSFGEMQAPHCSSRIESLKTALSVPGLILETSENLLVQQWQKFLLIASLGALTSASRLFAKELLRVPETRKLLEEAMTEVGSLAKSRGIALPQDAVEKAIKRVSEMPEDGTTSIQRDFAAGRRTELETFSGFITRESEKVGLSTPVHRVCYSLLLPNELKARSR